MFIRRNHTKHRQTHICPRFVLPIRILHGNCENNNYYNHSIHANVSTSETDKKRRSNRLIEQIALTMHWLYKNVHFSYALFMADTCTVSRVEANSSDRGHINCRYTMYVRETWSIIDLVPNKDVPIKLRFCRTNCEADFLRLKKIGKSVSSRLHFAQRTDPGISLNLELASLWLIAWMALQENLGGCNISNQRRLD